MRAVLKKFISYILSLWNIYAGLILSTIISIIVNWTSTRMDTATSYILLSVTCITVFTYIKKTLGRKHRKKKSFIEKVGATADTGIVKLNNTTNRLNALDSIETNSEVIGGAIVNTIEIASKIKIGGKIMKFFKWIKNYWQQWVDYIFTAFELFMYAYAIVLDKFGFIEKYIPAEKYWQIGFRIVVGVIALLGVILQLRNTSVWRGVGSNAKADELKASLKEQAIESVNSLSDEDKKLYKSLIKVAKANLVTAKNVVKTCQKAVETITTEFNQAKSLVIALQNANVIGERIENAIKKRDEYGTKLNTANDDLKTAEEKVVALEKEIESYEKVLGE